jgi:hypothetical protein
MGIIIITKIPNRPTCDIIILGDFNTSIKNENPYYLKINKGNNKITELRTILQRESQNS